MNEKTPRNAFLSALGGGAACSALVFAVILVYAGLIRTHGEARDDASVLVVMTFGLAAATFPAGLVIGGVAGALAARAGWAVLAGIGAGLGLLGSGLWSIHIVKHRHDFAATPVEFIPYLLGLTAAIGAVTALVAGRIARRR